MREDGRTATDGTGDRTAPARAGTDDRTGTGDRPPERRRFLQVAGATGGLGVAGCTSLASAPAGRVVLDPYADVDWSRVEHHRCEFHNHVRGGVDEPADVAELYHDLGYTVYAVADKGREPMCWPWTAFADLDEDFERNCDPESMGVVALPGCEFTIGEHVSTLCSTLDHDAADELGVDGPLDAIDAVLEADDHYVPASGGGLAVVAHPGRYTRSSWADWRRYRPHVERYSLQDGLLGFEVFNKESPTNGDVALWDRLLTEYAPDRPIWGFGVDDPHGYVLGEDVDVRWTTILLHEGEFDPADQTASRVAAATALRTGRTCCHQRPQWDDDVATPAPVPRVESVTVEDDGREIAVEVTDCDRCRWVSAGQVVETGRRIAVTGDHAPYLRLHLSNDAGGETSLQPFGVERL